MAVNFREKAKEKLASPEQLDRPVRNVPRYWHLAVLGIMLTAGAFLLWMFFGEIPPVV